MKRIYQSFLLITGLAISTSSLLAHDHKIHDRSPTSIGKVLVFGGTGWYRHPETAAINGWLSRLSDELKMQVDVTESAKDISTILSRYQVLILNNSNQLSKVLDQKQRKIVEDWYAEGGGIVALHAALVRQTEWAWLNALGGCDFDSDSESKTQRLEFASASDPYNGLSGEVIWNDEKQEGYMSLENLEVNDPTQNQYQLWIVDPERDELPVDGGVFDITQNDGKSVIPIRNALAINKPVAFVITLEQPGGVVKSKQEIVVALAKS
jgi:hypothetical protein